MLTVFVVRLRPLWQSEPQEHTPNSSGAQQQQHRSRYTCDGGLIPPPPSPWRLQLVAPTGD